jgi:hypothetical protein
MKCLQDIYKSYLEIKRSRGINYCILIGFLAFFLQLLWLFYFDFPIGLAKSAIYDGLYFAFLALLFLSFQRKIRVGAINLFVLALVIYAVAFFKFDAFGDVIRFSDVVLVPTLVEVLGFYHSMILIVPMILILLVFVLNFVLRLSEVAPRKQIRCVHEIAYNCPCNFLWPNPRFRRRYIRLSVSHEEPGPVCRRF